MVSVHECLDELHPGAAAGLLDLLRLRRSEHQQLLAQDVLAGCGGTHDPFRVARVRQSHVHGVDVGVGEQLVVGVVRPRDAEGRQRTTRPCRWRC
jgi:hypothetical protein